MIQDIEPNVYDNHYENFKPDDSSYIIFIGENKVLAKRNNDCLVLPKYSDLKCKDTDLIYLFSISDKKYFLASDETVSNELIENQYAFISMFQMRAMKPKAMFFAAVTAYQLAKWYKENKYCGCCGGPLRRDEKERMLFCDSCKIANYPKICPAVIVAVTDGDKLLLTKYAGREFTHYALIAGYNEIGEPIEDTVRREVMEEVGLKVKNITYYKSQPWSLTDTLLLGFFCEVDGDNTIKMDEDELSEASWLSREEIPVSHDDISLTYEMIAKFKDGI